MTNDSLAARRAAWADYWASGALHSCPGSRAGNYGGAIGAFWDCRIAGIPTDARILDVATGNGALPLRLWQSRGDAVHVDAIDFAPPAPGWHQPGVHPRIRFHGGVDMTSLPFEAASFDIVCSQYGIEYGMRPHALDEALRVLRRSGRLWLVLHHAGSELVDVARAEEGAYDWLSQEGGLLSAASRMAHWLAVAHGGGALPAAANDAREGYNRLLRECGALHGQARPRGLAVDVVQAIHSALGLASQGRAEEAQDALARYRGDLARARLRGGELVSHALSAEDIRDWSARISSVWPQAEVACDVLRQQEGIVGWALTAEARQAG